MLTIRLSRVGRKNQPSYRIIVNEKGRDPWGKALEILGNYNPRRKPAELVMNVERIKYWMSKGAEASPAVWNILVSQKVVEGKKKSVTHISKTRKAALDEAKAKEAEAKKAAEAPKAEEPKPEEKPAA
jgi:small subunit ribosomal protein S16